MQWTPPAAYVPPANVTSPRCEVKPSEQQMTRNILWTPLPWSSVSAHGSQYVASPRVAGVQQHRRAARSPPSVAVAGGARQQYETCRSPLVSPAAAKGECQQRVRAGPACGVEGSSAVKGAGNPAAARDAIGQTSPNPPRGGYPSNQPAGAMGAQSRQPMPTPHQGVASQLRPAPHSPEGKQRARRHTIVTSPTVQTPPVQTPPQPAAWVPLATPGKFDFQGEFPLAAAARNGYEEQATRHAEMPNVARPVPAWAEAPSVQLSTVARPATEDSNSSVCTPQPPVLHSLAWMVPPVAALVQERATSKRICLPNRVSQRRATSPNITPRSPADVPTPKRTGSPAPPRLANPTAPPPVRVTAVPGVLSSTGTKPYRLSAPTVTVEGPPDPAPTPPVCGGKPQIPRLSLPQARADAPKDSSKGYPSLLETISRGPQANDVGPFVASKHSDESTMDVGTSSIDPESSIWEGCNGDGQQDCVECYSARIAEESVPEDLKCAVPVPDEAPKQSSPRQQVIEVQKQASPRQQAQKPKPQRQQPKGQFQREPEQVVLRTPPPTKELGRKNVAAALRASKTTASPRVAQAKRTTTPAKEKRVSTKGPITSPRTRAKATQSALGLYTTAKPERIGDTIRSALGDEAKARRYASECFAKFDRDSNGQLSFEELRECMKHVNMNLGIDEFGEREVEHYLRRFDTNSDGALSCAEFQEFYRYLLLVKLNIEEPTPFCREMFLGRRRGRPKQDYEVVASLGSGSYGVVEKVVCRATKSVRVMKTIDKEKAEESGLPTKLVMEEIQKLKALDHPAVLRLFEYYVDASALYLITDLLSGGDLCKAVEDAHQKNALLSESWIKTIFRQVCEGVNYIHGKGVMHKDLKLDNVMLESFDPPEAVIIDVGLAELFPVSTADQFHSSDVAGTLATMAPEVLARNFTYKCDVWSLGCCLYALFCSKPIWYEHSDGSAECYPYPFKPPRDETSAHFEAYVRRQIRGPDLTNTHGSLEAQSLIRKMLCVSETQRPTMQEVLRHRWFARQLSGSTSGGSDSPVRLSRRQVDCLLNFSHAIALEEAVLLDVASQLPLGELRELRSLFEHLDQNGDGKLDVAELAHAMQEAGLDAEGAEQAANKFAVDGFVEFSRFIAALVPSSRELMKQHLRDAFNRLDANGDGYIVASELTTLFADGNLKDLKASQATRSIFEALGYGSGSGNQKITFARLSEYFMELCV